MLKFSICAEMFFRELPYEDRVKQISKAGFKYVEFWKYSSKDWKAIQKINQEYNLQITAFCAEGINLVNPELKSQNIVGLKQSIDKAVETGVSVIIITVGQASPELSRKTQHQAIVQSLGEVATYLKDKDIIMCLEPLNTLVDHQGYFLDSTSEAVQICDEVGCEKIKILYDIYHMQIMEGNIIDTLKKFKDCIGHIHTANVPGRHELDLGELNYQIIFDTLQEIGYKGYVGMEYSPTLPDQQSLERMKKLYERG